MTRATYTDGTVTLTFELEPEAAERLTNELIDRGMTVVEQ